MLVCKRVNQASLVTALGCPLLLLGYLASNLVCLCLGLHPLGNIQFRTTHATCL